MKKLSKNHHFKIHDSAVGRKGWNDALNKIPPSLKDIYFYPEYMKMNRVFNKSRALLFEFIKGKESMVYPFLMSPIKMSDQRFKKGEFFDISSAYGYGGPLSSTKNKNFIKEGHSLFREWCIQNNVVVEFIRFHPLIKSKNLLTSDFQRNYDRKTVSIKLVKYSLRLSSEKKSVWRKIKRGQALGLKTMHSRGRVNFQKFLKMYRKTMNRLGAEKEYYFNHQYFHNLEQLVRKSGLLIVALHRKSWVSAAIFLVGKKWLHYHLSANDPKKYLPHATSVVIHEAAKWGSDQGLTRLHLGGGRSPALDDSLLRYKKSIGDDFHDFYIGRRVFRPEIYSHLKKKWLEKYPQLKSKHGSKALFYRFTS